MTGSVRGPNGNEIFPFIQARHYRPIPPAKPRSINKLVLHTMQGGDRYRKARNTAMWIAGRVIGSSPPEVSFHFAVDPDEIIQCVLETDVAYHARGGNRDSIGIEMAGNAEQTLEQWQDDFSAAVIEKTLRLCTLLCRRWSIPADLLGVEDLVADSNARGITTHYAVSQAHGKSNHFDPGPHFPLPWFVAEVDRRLKIGG